MNSISQKARDVSFEADLLFFFPVFREYILKTAKALVEDTKLLVSGAGSSQEKLAQAAQSSVTTITKLADVVKLGAASLGNEDPETQVQSCLCIWYTAMETYIFRVKFSSFQSYREEGVLFFESSLRYVSGFPAGRPDQCSERCGQSSG